MKNNLYILIGVPGVGKSTFIKENKIDGDVVLSSDEIRFEKYGSLKEGNKHNNEVFNILHTRLDNSIDKHNVFYDATNLHRGRRKAIFDKYKNRANVKAILIVEPLDVIVTRNASRGADRYVPEDTVRAMYHRLEIPAIGIDCHEIEVLNEYSFEHEYNIDLPHMSPYHMETIQTHIERAIENADTDILKEIARNHDKGKFICRRKCTESKKHQDFLNTYGELYRYIDHEKVSAMYYLAEHELTEETMFIAEIIFWHSRFGQFSDKMLSKCALDENGMKLLEEFNRIDRMSSTVFTP